MYLFGNGHQYCKSPLGNGRHVYVTKDHVIDFGIVSSCICTLQEGPVREGDYLERRERGGRFHTIFLEIGR